MHLIAVVVGLAFLARVGENEPAVHKGRGGVELRAKQQTVMLSACDGKNRGAGIVVGEDESSVYVLTASHLLCRERTTPCAVIDVCTDPTSRFFSLKNGDFIRSQPIYRDDSNDLAAISIPKRGLERSALRFRFNLARDPSTARRGDHLFIVGALGNVQGWFVPAEPFFLAGVAEERIEFGPTGAAYEGVSGGPLCNADGEIIGLVQDKGSAVGIAKPITAALDKFKSWNSNAKRRLFAERRFPVLKPHYTEIGADAAFPSLSRGLSSDGPGVNLHVAHGISRLVAAAFDATILYARGEFPDFIETQQILIPSGGLQVQPFADLARRAMHETLGGFYLGGGLGYGFVTRSVQGPRVGAKENLSSLMFVTEAGYRWPLPPRGWGLKISYRVYQPVRSQGLERATGFALGLYGAFR